jgi:outer membrane protein TolC
MRPTLPIALVLLALAAFPPNARAQEPTRLPAPVAEPKTLQAAPDPMLQPAPRPRRSISSWAEALSLVLANSADLRVAYDEVQQASAQTRIALAQALPSLSGQGSLVHNFITSQSSQVVGVSPADNPIFGSYTAPSPTYLQGGLKLTQPLLAAAAWHAIGTASVSEEASRLSEADLKRTLSMSLALAIVGVVTAERVAELNRVGLRSAQDRLDLAVTRERLGGGTGLDVARARQDLDAAREALVAGDEALRRAREALGLGLGLGEQVGVAPNSRLEGFASGVLRACPATDALDSRADVVAARKRVEAAARSVTDVGDQFLPTLSAQSTLSTTTADTGAVPNTLWDIQAILTVPIWDGGARYGLLRHARAAQDAETHKLAALRRTVAVQIDQAHRGVEVAERSLVIAADARSQAADIDRISQAAYRAGQGTSLDLVLAATALRQAEITLALLEYGLVKARIIAVLTLAKCQW